ncbi:hypothetical protein [Sphingomicrobium nitratireducens]|uniref:hypothetical protein n=1 Tax=Sphingomicrobium nitratireducens TaxID=2964666 RepID=UPI00224064D7|nr:hypothetical protein [Sphingomicrobium nitratireducens]
MGAPSSSADDVSYLVALGRRDGFTPRKRARFLDRLACGAVVSAAARYAGISPGAAYRLRARCYLFSAAWDAAIELARAPLADALYERAVLGVTSTYFRDENTGEIHRHAHDNRLAFAVLTRLDAHARAARHALRQEDGADEEVEIADNIRAHWDAFLLALDRADEDALMAIAEGHSPPAPEDGDEDEDGDAAPLFYAPKDDGDDAPQAAGDHPPTHRGLSALREGKSSYAPPRQDAP